MVQLKIDLYCYTNNLTELPIIPDSLKQYQWGNNGFQDRTIEYVRNIQQLKIKEVE